MIILNYTTTIHDRFVFQMTILSVKAFSTVIKNLILKVISISNMSEWSFKLLVFFDIIKF